MFFQMTAKGIAPFLLTIRPASLCGIREFQLWLFPQAQLLRGIHWFRTNRVQKRTAAQWASYTGMRFTAGTIVGYVAFGFFADIFGRKPIIMLYFALSLLLTPVMFLWISSLTTLLTIAALVGCFCSGQFTWMSTWLPELYPTRMRATGAGFIFNASRIPAAFGVLIASAIIAQLGGYGNAAMTIATVYLLGLAAAPFLPETHGKPLPR